MLREAGIAAEVAHPAAAHRLRAPGAAQARRAARRRDFGRLLVLVEEDADCYAVLGELHTCFTPVISEFKDFIAAPKFNLYQSLHTAVADARGRGRRSPRPHHGRCTASPRPGSSRSATRTPGRRRPPSAERGRARRPRPGPAGSPGSWSGRAHAPDPDTFWAELRDELAQDREITVFSRRRRHRCGLPAGRQLRRRGVRALRRGGPPLHRRPRQRAAGRPQHGAARRRHPPAVPGAPGDAPSGPSPEWLEHARTPAARIAISRWLAAHPAGRTRRPAGPPTDRGARRRHRSGTGRAAERGAPCRSRPRPGARRRPSSPTSRGAAVRLARCCTPVPPDAVTGFAVRGGTVTVHRDACQAVTRMTAAGPRRPVPVRWEQGAAPAAG